MKWSLSRTLAFALALSLSPVAGSAADPSAMAEVTLLPGWRTAEGVHVAGLRIRLEPGWKTYWRAPGEAGIPPDLDWSGSRNLVAAETRFPAPEVFDSYGVQTIGYTGEVILPLLLKPSDPAAPMQVTADVSLGVCHDICMPMTTTVRATLPPGGTPDPAIRAALADEPRVIDTRLRCAMAPIADGVRVEMGMRAPDGMGPEAVAVIESGDPSIWVSETETVVRGAALVATADLVPPRGAPLVIDRSRLKVTVIGPRGAVETVGCDAG